jgi:predicted lipid carrier protein YhbT
LASHPEAAPKLEEVLSAFVLPMLEFAASEHLAARALVSAQFLSGGAHRMASADKLQETVERRFLAAFAAALPGLDMETLHGRYRFLEGALTLAMCGTDKKHAEALADASAQKAARQAAMEADALNFLAFAAAGLRSH